MGVNALAEVGTGVGCVPRHCPGNECFRLGFFLILFDLFGNTSVDQWFSY